MPSVDMLAERMLPQVGRLVDLDEDVLYRQLSEQSMATSTDEITRHFGAAEAARHFAMDVRKYDPEEQVRTNSGALGRRLLAAWNVSLHSLICSDKAGNAELRNKVIDALKIGKTQAAAMIAAVAVSYLGLAPAIAALVGTLVVTYLIVPTHETLCEYWAERLAQA